MPEPESSPSPKTEPHAVPPAKPFWESTWFRLGALLLAPMAKNVLRKTIGPWLVETFDVDVMSWNKQLVADVLTIIFVGGVAVYAWLRTAIPRKVIAAMLALAAIYLGFRAGASQWSTVTALQWVASGVLAVGALYFWGRRIWLGLSPAAPDFAPIKGTEKLGPAVTALVEAKIK